MDEDVVRQHSKRAGRQPQAVKSLVAQGSRIHPFLVEEDRGFVVHIGSDRIASLPKQVRNAARAARALAPAI